MAPKLQLNRHSFLGNGFLFLHDFCIVQRKSAHFPLRAETGSQSLEGALLGRVVSGLGEGGVLGVGRGLEGSGEGAGGEREGGVGGETRLEVGHFSI